ncbi:hypothetical protein CDD82_6699 [Ophiocordyceps australis]|uniref:FAD-binding domain-containing protein n=1 Tax=Ophiocordyceps australis TaxID=1399860 RepID=A0A2C5ZQU9_9HYPO|nr:hypothetical protein CDD82_6699 [Ophiocordyceps australis]
MTASPGPDQSAQVIVVGAGLSGLQAAHGLEQAGISCIVLEARQHAASPVWYHGVDSSHHGRLGSLARKMGVELSAPEAHGSVAFALEINSSFVRVRDNLESLCHRIDINRPARHVPNYGSSTLHELVVSQGGDAAVQAVAESWAQGLFGLSAHHVSALYFLVHCKSAGGVVHLLSALEKEPSPTRERQLHDLCRELASRLRPGSLQLGQSVEAVDQRRRNQCVVSTKSGQVFSSTYVLVADAASHCRSLCFLPDLSDDKQWLRGSVAVTDTHRLCLDCTTCALGSGLHERRASPCLAVPAERLGELERDQWRPEGAVFFAGADTSYVWRGHAEGALTAADRAVDEVLRAMGRVAEVPMSRL